MEKKKIKKSIESLERQREEHRKKIENYGGANYALIGYWEKEINSFNNKIEELKKKLNKK